MRWAKLDTRYLMNEKVRAASAQHRLAPLVHVAAILHAADHLTDGLADTEIVLAIARAPRAALTACLDHELLVEVDAQTVRVHDYTEWQTPAEQVKKTSESRSVAGKKGADSRWGHDSAEWQNGKTDGKSMASAMANTMAAQCIEHRTKNIEQREREQDAAQSADALSHSELTQVMADALTARAIPHRVTPSWQTTWERVTSRYGFERTRDLLVWAMTEPSDFWATTCTTPARFERNLDTIIAQHGRRRAEPRPGHATSARVGESPPEPPAGLQSENERDAWRLTWRQHRARGITAELATDYTNADLGITNTNIIDIKKYA